MRAAWRKVRAEVIAKAWKDPEFKKKLKKDPASVLREMGLQIPASLKVRLIEDDTNILTFVLPHEPRERISADELDRVAAAGGCTQDTNLTDSVCVCDISLPGECP
jgi:hypothetical protein